MIRVVYQWHVEPEQFQEFKETWTHTTNNIHETVSGALGSFMIKSIENPKEVITIAKWESLQAWKDFWGTADPAAMEAMGKLGKRISAKAFEEVDDFTK
ncbi:MAG: antibiotic biosynthesis monooxygenase [Bacteroidota bacterium]